MEKSSIQERKLCSDCLRFCRNGDVKQLTELLSSGCKVNARAPNKFTPLMIAARYGHSNLVDALLPWNADVNSEDVNGNTALMIACLTGHWQCAQSLLYSWSADLDKKNDTGSTALILTTSSLSCAGHLRCIKHLVEQDADLNVKNDMSMTALMYCVDSQEFGLSALRILVDAGADTDILHDGESLLMMAVRRKHLPIVEYLLTSQDVDIQLMNKDWDNALIIALKFLSDNSQIVDLLLKAGSDPNSKSSSGCNAINIAAATGFENTRLLLSSGAIPKLSYIFISGNKDQDILNSLQACGSIFTPVDVAILNKNFTTANFLLTAVGCRPFSLFDSYSSIPLNYQSESAENFNVAIREMISMAHECPGWIEKWRILVSRPKLLQQFCIASISRMAGRSPGRRERLNAVGLPPRLVKLVLLDNVTEQEFLTLHV